MSPERSRRCICGVKNKHLESIHHVSTNNSSCKSDLRASYNSPELSGEVPQSSTLGQIILSCMAQGSWCKICTLQSEQNIDVCELDGLKGDTAVYGNLVQLPAQPKWSMHKNQGIVKLAPLCTWQFVS